MNVRGSLIAALLLVAACDDGGRLELWHRHESPRAAPPGVYLVEPFDYHYPDEEFFDSSHDAVHLTIARNEVEAGTFVYVPARTGETARLRPRDLVAMDGRTLPASAIRTGVVLYGERRPQRLDLCWLGGIRHGGTSRDPRGLHQDCRERLPVVPLAIVPDAVEVMRRAPEAAPILTLQRRSEARAATVNGRAIQFWITVRVPPSLPLDAFRTRFEGVIELLVGEEVLEVPIEIDVLDLLLDALRDHGKHAGVMNALDGNPPELRDAILDDLVDHGCNALRDAIDVPLGYEDLASRGFDLIVHSNADLDAEAIAQIDALGVAPYVYHGRHETDLYFGTADPDPAALEAIAVASAIRARGGLYADSMRLPLLRTVAESVPVDFWAHAISIYQFEPRLAAEHDALLAHLERVRTTPEAKLARIESHYAEVFGGHVPLEARLLTGFFIARSNLDGAMPWGYALLEGGIQPFTDPSYVGVAFPVRYEEVAPGEPAIEMLPSPTWEAFREGVDDLRYALTATRIAAERGTDAQRQRIEALLGDYGQLYVAGDRLNYRKRAIDVRLTREALVEVLEDMLTGSVEAANR